VRFSTGSIQGIRSISQRSLAVYWQRLGGKSQTIPSFNQFQPEERIHDPKQLAVWKVETGEEESTFRALYRGRLVGEAFNEGWVGRTLVEVTPPTLQNAIVGASNECEKTGCAIYTILRTYDSAYRAVDLERLLLPFGENGRVEHIVASLQLVSLKGSFQRQTVVRKFEARSVCVLSIRIPLDEHAGSAGSDRLESVGV
jgi:hypothetical protein